MTWKGWRDVRRSLYTPFEWLTTIGLIVLMWAVFFVFIGFMARTAKELFCIGFGC